MRQNEAFQFTHPRCARVFPIEKWQKHFRENGFLDKAATFDTRHQVSKSYFERGIGHYLKTEAYDALANAYLNLGFAYYFLGQPAAECGPYVKAIEYHYKSVTKDPRAPVNVPEGAGSFKDYVAGQQKRAGCENGGGE